MATAKTDKTDDVERFSFEHDGKTYTFENGFEVVSTPKWLRANRRRDELDLTFTILEALAGDDVLEVIDEMDTEQFAELSQSVHKALSAAMK